MAEAAVDPARFFCHGCSRHFTQNSTNLVCPHCDSGFVEEVQDDASFDDSFQSDVDVEEYHNGAASALELLGGSFMNFMPGMADSTGHPGDSSAFGDPISFFSFNIRPGPSQDSSSSQSDTAGASSSQPSSERERQPRTGYLRISRSINPQNNSNPGGSDPGPQNAFVEGLLQQLLSGADPGAMFGGGGGGTAIFNAGGPVGGPMGMFSLHGNPGDYAWGVNGLDDIITRLLGQLENSGAPPASQSAIQRLPTVNITKEHVDSHKDCSVCMDTFSLDDTAKRLPCEHMFHIKCIDQWLKLHNTCPICRTNIEANNPTSCPGANNVNSQSTSGPSTSGI